jgi:chaperonin GroES
MLIKPLHDRIIVKPIPTESVTSSGLIIPDTAKEKPQKGTVMAVGSKVEICQVNDIALYGKFAGIDIEIEGEAYLIMRESDIFAVV